MLFLKSLFRLSVVENLYGVSFSELQDDLLQVPFTVRQRVSGGCCVKVTSRLGPGDWNLELSAAVVNAVVSVRQMDVVYLQRRSSQTGHGCGVTVQLLKSLTVVL